MEDLEPILRGIQRGFGQNVESVHELLGFDRLILDTAIGWMEGVRDGLRKQHGIENQWLVPESGIQALRQIRQNDSLRPSYQTMFNQTAVLLVSYFGSAVHDIFRRSTPFALRVGLAGKWLKEEVRLPVSDVIAADFDLWDKLGDLIAGHRDYNFQDMKSIARASLECFGFEPEKTKDVNNIDLID